MSNSQNKLNLDVKSYDDDELCNLLNLQYPYNKDDIAISCDRLKQQIGGDMNLEEREKKEIDLFLTVVNNRLSQSLEKGTTEQEELLRSKIITGPNNFKNIKRDKVHSTYEVKAIPGVVNPIDKDLIIKSLNIDTKFRDNYYASSSTDLQLNLPTTIKNVLSMTLRAIELPYTFYSISAALDNNYFTITTNEGGPYLITIPDGNYTSEQFVEYVNTVALPKHSLHSKIKMEIEQTNRRTVISKKNSATEVTSLTVDFGVKSDGTEDDINPVQMKLGWIMGFRLGKYTGSTAYVSEGLCDFKGSRYVFLSVDDFNNNVNNYFTSAFSSSILNNNILGRISMKKDAFNINTVISSDMITKTRSYFGPVNIQKLKIQLLDEYGRVMNLNNMDFSFCLDFTCIYDM